MTSELDWDISIVHRSGSAVVPRLLDATYDWDTSRAVVSGGSFSTVDDPGNVIGARLQLVLGGEAMGWFAITACSPHHTGLGSKWSVEFMDDASQLEKTKLIKPVAYAAARPISATLKSRLAAIGLTATIADNDETLRTAKAWAAGSTTELQVINDLLSTIGFHGLWPSPFGLYSAKHVEPDTASVAHTFTEGEESLHLPSYPMDSDYLSIPNRLMVTSKGDTRETPLTAVAQDVATSPWSYNARGFWVDAEPVEVDSTSQEGLMYEANRRLKALQSSAVTMTIRHAWNPRIVPGAVVEIVASNQEVAGRWQATGSSISSGVDALSSTSLRKV